MILAQNRPFEHLKPGQKLLKIEPPLINVANWGGQSGHRVSNSTAGGHRVTYTIGIDHMPMFWAQIHQNGQSGCATAL